MDTFLEKIVAKRKGIKDILLTIGIIFLGLLLIMVIQMFLPPEFGSFFLFIAFGIGYLVYLFITSRNVEFEYIVTNGDLDIDKIIARRKRKRIFSASCKDFDIVAKVKSEQYGRSLHNIKNRIEAVSSMESEGAYFATLTYKGERTMVLFEPDQRMLNNFKIFIPKKVFTEG